MTLLQPGCVLVSVVHVIIGDHASAWSLGHCLGQCWCLNVRLPVGACLFQRSVLPPGAMVTSRNKLLSRSMSRFKVLQHPGSELMSEPPFTTKGHCSYPGSGQSSKTLLMSKGHSATRVILTWVTGITYGAMVTSRSVLLKGDMGIMNVEI